MRNKKIIQASLLVVLSGLLYGFLGYLGTEIMRDGMAMNTMLFWRFLIAGIWISFFIIKKSITHHMFRIDKRLLLFVCILGVVGYAAASALYFVAAQYTGTGLAMVIFFSYPIMIALASWLKHPTTFSIITFLSLVAMSVGLFLLNGSSGVSVNSIGIFFAIMSAICYAFYIIGSKRVAINIDSNIISIIVCFSSALIFLILALSSHIFIFPKAMHTWLCMIALGVLATAIPIQLMLVGLKYISSIRASIISVLEPLVTVFVGIILLHESVSGLQLFGSFIILASALAIQFQKGV